MLQYVTPLPPLQTGVAGYSRDLLQAGGNSWDLRVIGEPGSNLESRWLPTVARRADRDSPAIAHVGNSGYHPRAMALAVTSSPILVLHDVVLHQGRLAELIRRRGGRDYLELMTSLYGEDGRWAARAMLSGGPNVSPSNFPLFEDLVNRSVLTIVHSEYARARVLERVPDAVVHHVPMGIPLPALVDQREARSRLALPESAFIIASITHVNPNKRLHVVFRALRRLKDQLPEVLLVVAGSVSPSIDLPRLAKLYGVERHVRLLGYVSDGEARLVARSSDVCVNLRYPSAGETSASLLRLLGAGRPVIVTDDLLSAEYPRTVALPVAVDPFEDEIIAEIVLLLASNDALREEVGDAARAYIQRGHTMTMMIDGYRRAVADAYGIALPAVAEVSVQESEPTTAPPAYRGAGLRRYSSLDGRIADIAVRGGIASHDGTMQRIASTMARLGLDQVPVNAPHDDGGIRMSTERDGPVVRDDLLEILACPVCQDPVRLEVNEIVCGGCGRRYPVEDGIPIMLPDAARLP